MRRRYTRKQRSELVDLVATGQATVPEAASQLRVAPSTAYYWIKRGRSGGEPGHESMRRGRKGPAFVRLVPSSEVVAVLAVRVGGAEIEIRHGFDADLLRAVVEAIGGGAG
jgi:transposase-like protein